VNVLNGVGVSPGHAAGPPLIIRDAGHDAVTPGAIIIARVVHPYLAPLFLTIGGVVAEDGGLLQHAAILAREFGIPAVVGVQDAVQALTGARLITVDGTTGDVVAEFQ
jgi:phosphohistidine swiveling domain-containing protein